MTTFNRFHVVTPGHDPLPTIDEIDFHDEGLLQSRLCDGIHSANGCRSSKFVIAQTLPDQRNTLSGELCRFTQSNAETPSGGNLEGMSPCMRTESIRSANAIVATLPETEGRRFAALCERVTLEQGDVLCESNQNLQTAYFPTSGVISLAMVLGNRSPLQLGLIGRDGMLGATLALDTLATPMLAVVQIAGCALTLPAARLQQELVASPRLLAAVNHYQYRLMMQTLQTSACLHFHEIEPRLARWLLMIRDLGHTEKVRFTHKLVSHALGVRRSGITLAAGSLQRQGLIRYARGEIHIVDCPGLEVAACECHGALTERYRAVFGSGQGHSQV